MVPWGSLAAVLALVLLTVAATGGRDRRPSSGTATAASRQVMPTGETAATEHVSVGDVEIAYREWGRGEPLVLITGFVATMDVWDPVLVAGNPVKIAGRPEPSSATYPRIGEHTEQVLRERLGMAAEQLRRLQQTGVIGTDGRSDGGGSPA